MLKRLALLLCFLTLAAAGTGAEARPREFLTILQGSSGVAPAAPLTLPTGMTNPTSVYSVARLSTWGGSALQVRRASDGALLDIGFSGNRVDKTAADAFMGSSSLTVVKWYDQTGNGNDLSQSVVANQPAFTALNEQFGFRPVTIDGLPVNTTKWLQNNTLVGDRSLFSVFMTTSTRNSAQSQSYWEFTTDSTLASRSVLMNNAGNTLVVAGQFNIASSYARSHLGTISYSSNGASGALIRVNGNLTTSGTVVNSAAIGGLLLGKAVEGTVFNANNDMFALITYMGATFNNAQMASLDAAQNATFTPTSSWPKRLVYGGSSLVTSYFATLNQQTPWQSGYGRGTDWETYVMAIGGQSLATEYANRAIYTARYNATQSPNYLVIDAPSNDISLITFTSQADAYQWADDFFGITNTGRATNTTIPFFNAMRTAGYARVVVPTIIARGSFTSANFREDARLRYNTNAANYTATGYSVSNRAANSMFSTPAAAANPACYATDQIHLINVCYAILSAIDNAMIQAP